MKKVLMVDTESKSNLLSVNLAAALLEAQREHNISLDEQLKMLELKKKNLEKFRFNEVLLPTSDKLVVNSQSDEKLLDRFGFNVSDELRNVNEQINSIKLEKAEVGVFSKREIGEVAIKYRLRFLPARKYKGELDPQLPQKIREGCEKYKDEMPSYYGDVWCYILAPHSSFQLSERPKDPLCFLRLQNGRFALIHKWGNDLSLFRKIAMWPKRASENWAATMVLTFTMLLYQFIAPSFKWPFTIMSYDWVHNNGGWVLTFALATIGFFIILCHVGPKKYSVDNWDSEYYD